MKHTHETLDIVPPHADIVLVGLNPTLEAVTQKAVFCNNNAFWNLLIKANVLHESILIIEKKDRAKAAFEEQKHSTWRVGFADMLPLVVETNSNKVVIPCHAARDFIENNENIKTAKKLVLMGQKVVDAFAKEFQLKKWNQLSIENGLKKFDTIGSIEINGQAIEIIAVPFPVNNSIKDKPSIYKNAIGLN